MKWYQLGIKEVFHQLSTSENGLTDEEAKKRLAQYGPNNGRFASCFTDVTVRNYFSIYSNIRLITYITTIPTESQARNIGFFSAR